MSKENMPAVKTDATIGNFLQTRSASLAEYALRNYDQQAFLKSAMLCINENAELQKCLVTEDGRASLFHALRYAASTGLSLNPQIQKAALIPYGGKVQYQIMKSGMVDLAMDSGKIDFITADYVRENDVFELTKSIDCDSYRFVPSLKDRGNIMGFFAAVKMNDGHAHVKWMTKEEVEEHRDKYSKMKNGPWMTSFNGMGVKTVLKSLLRNLNLSPEMNAAVSGDDKSASEVHDITEEVNAEKQKGTCAQDVADALKKNDNPEQQKQNQPQGKQVF